MTRIRWEFGTQGSAWSIFHQNFQAMVANAGFVVTNSKPGPAAFAHRAQACAAVDRMGFARRTCPVLERALDLISQSPGLQRVRARWRPGVVATAFMMDDGTAGRNDGVLLAEPAVGSMNPNHEHVFGQGTDGQLFQKWWAADGGWRGWFPLGRPCAFVGRPATVSRNPQVCNVYVRGKDNALWQLAWFNGRWNGWGGHADGVLASPPAVGSMNSNHEHVFVRGTDGQVWVKWWLQGSGWSAWAPLGAPPAGFIGGPAVSQGPVTCDLFVRGKDNALWQRSFRSGVWGSWERHNDGGVLADDPAAASMQPNHLQIFVRGTDGKVWQKFWVVGIRLGEYGGTQPPSITHPSTETQTPFARQPRTGIRVAVEGLITQNTWASTSPGTDGQSSTRTGPPRPPELVSTFALRHQIGALFIALGRTTFRGM
jgi:hypothetical protein